MSLAKVYKKYGKEISALTNALKKHQKSCFENHHKIFEERQKILNLIQNHICSKNSFLLSLGSTVTKLSDGNNSDLDVAFLSKDESFWNVFLENEDFKIFFMEVVSEMLEVLYKVDEKFKLAEPINKLYFLKTPLITSKFQNGLAMDLQFPQQSWQAIRNTFLVKHYVMADERFSQLYFYVRAVFVALGLKNSREGLFSSYHIICLVIHFLHRKSSKPSVVPILCETLPEYFNPNFSKTELLQNFYSEKSFLEGWKSKNTKSSGQLAVQFFYYYSTFFNPCTMSIFISSGNAKNKKFPKDGRINRLVIIDPYDKNSVCRSDLICDVINLTFKFIWKAIKEDGQYLNSFPDFSEESKLFRSAFASEKWANMLDTVEETKSNTVPDIN